MRPVFMMVLLLLISAALAITAKGVEAFTSSGTLIQLATSHVGDIGHRRNPVFIQDVNGFIYDYVSQY
jgi:hypothetical protein